MRSILLSFKVASDLKRQNKQRKQNHFSVLIIALFIITGFYSNAQGTWSPVLTNCPAPSGGGLLLLSDGTVMCKTTAGTIDGIGNTWYKLTPDVHGSYVNGTWAQLLPMISTRLYFSSQVLKDGRVYVAGGEYGTGGARGETYNPLANVWTATPAPGATVSDANSEILENGYVLQAMVSGNLKSTKLYNPDNNTYVSGPTCIGIHNESVWIKLPDNSILMVDRNTKNSERYIPSLNQWVADATVPVSLYDPYGLESGAALLLPDGRGFFIGSPGHTAFYTPSGTNSPGVWTAGPDIPNGQGQPDAPAAMMVNGKVLLACSAAPTSSNHFPSPTSYYEFDYLTNSYTRINAPAGGLTTNASCYNTTLLDLPDGTVLYSLQGSNTFYIYTPDGTPLTSGKPKISNIKKVTGTSYRITGTLFNGISEGAAYGDDWQMASNYPIVRLTSGTNVYYARTSNWNSTGVMRGNLPDTAFITPPQGLLKGKTYALTVIANGISSNPIMVPGASLVSDNEIAVLNNAQSNHIPIKNINPVSIYPNPANNQTMINFSVATSAYVSIEISDMNGKVRLNVFNGNVQKGEHSQPADIRNLSAGVYMVKITTEKGEETAKLIVQ